MTWVLFILMLVSQQPPGKLVDEAILRARRRPKVVYISGTVRDWNGQPMAGVTVTATTEGR